MMEDGKPFDYSFFKRQSWVFIYDNFAAADLLLRVLRSGNTLLVDTNYPSETYPIDLVAIQAQA
jgi:hypothetical protein